MEVQDYIILTWVGLCYVKLAKADDDLIGMCLGMLMAIICVVMAFFSMVT